MSTPEEIAKLNSSIADALGTRQFKSIQYSQAARHTWQHNKQTASQKLNLAKGSGYKRTASEAALLQEEDANEGRYMVDDAMLDAVASTIAGNDTGLSEHAQRKEKEHMAYIAAQPVLAAQQLHAVPLVEVLKQKCMEFEVSQVQATADAFVHLHRNACAECFKHAFKAEDYACQGRRPVTYVSFNVRHRIEVPCWHSKHCGQIFEASPVYAGCWPSSPTNPDAWINQDVIRLHTYLAQMEGVSTTGKWCASNAVYTSDAH